MLHDSMILWRRHCRTNRLTQIGVIMLFWLAGDAMVKTAGLPIPGAIFGLFLVIAMLGTGLISVRSIRLGSSWFIGEMLLFFVPAVLVVLDHPEFIGLLGLKILAVIIIGTGIVMTATALFVEFGYLYLIRAKRAKTNANAIKQRI